MRPSELKKGSDIINGQFNKVRILEFLIQRSSDEGNKTNAPAGDLEKTEKSLEEAPDPRRRSTHRFVEPPH